MTDIVERLRSVGRDYDFHENAYIFEAADEIERLRERISELELHCLTERTRTDARGRVWKLNDEGYSYLISKDEHRDIFLLRRKGYTFKAIGDLYQVTGGHARMLVSQHMTRRQSRVFRYLQIRNKRVGGNQ